MCSEVCAEEDWMVDSVQGEYMYQDDNYGDVECWFEVMLYSYFYEYRWVRSGFDWSQIIVCGLEYWQF